MSIIRDLKLQFKAGNLLTQLIVINSSCFLLINLVRLFLFFVFNQQQQQFVFNQLLGWLAMPLAADKLLLRPWTIITHFFLHYEIFHLFWNMVILYTFGRIYQEYNGNSRVLSLYCYGAITGALLALLAYKLPTINQAADFSILLGASGGIMAIVVAAATLVPNHLVGVIFIGEVRLKFIALFVILIDLISIPTYSNIGGHISHLGGALFGYIFIQLLKKGTDLSKGFNALFYGFIGLFKFRSKNMKVVHRAAKRTDEEYNLNQKRTQEQVDKILDKISKSGYESLTKAEKEVLFKVSENKK